MDAETKQVLEAMEARISNRLDQIIEQTRDTETKLLSAFHGWASPVDVKLRALPLLDQRMGLLEERITALERKNLERGI